MNVFEYKHSVLLEDFPEVDYEYRTLQAQGTKFGQRKLFFALLQFLTFYCRPSNIPKRFRKQKKKYVIVYAGAAHGDNISFASKLRPDVEFHLYDPGTFNISETENIRIYSPGHQKSFRESKKGFFSDREAKYWETQQKENGNIFFMSDIRIIESDSDERLQEYQIQKDMDLQMRWVQIIKPVYSQLKFRLPFKLLNRQQLSHEYRKYLPGVVYFGFWTDESTETRLVVSEKQSQQEVYWNSWKYEKNLAYYNKFYRTSNWQIDLPGSRALISEISPPELINDYDSMAEAFLWREYLVSIQGEKAATQSNIAVLSSKLTNHLGRRKISALRKAIQKEFAPF